MTNVAAASTDYRKIGDTTLAVYEAEFRRVTSPMLASAKATYIAATPHSALFLAQSWMENQHKTTGILIRPHHNNPVGLRPETPGNLGAYASGIIAAPDGSQFLTFATDALCAMEWKRRLFTDPTYKEGVYARTTTLREMLAAYAPSGDRHPVTGLDNAAIGYADAVTTLLTRYAAQEGLSMAITFGNVPKPPIQARILSNAEAREGHGWDNLGKRNPKFIALHRMVGTLWGTDTYFRDPNVPSLTDFGLGIEIVDGAANAGKILQWNDYTGFRSGWASGPVNGAYGDGLAIVQKYGINAVNRDGISIETSGTDQPLDEKSWRSLVHLCAFLIDEMKIPHTSLPLNPHTGINVLIWHNEFTNGTGKQCPFPWMRSNTDRLYADITAFLKPYQDSKATPVTPPAEKPRTVDFLVPMMIRTSPGFYDYDNNKANTITTLPAGTKGTVISGPVQKDGMDWYDVRIDGFGTGWVAKQIINAIQVK